MFETFSERARRIVFLSRKLAGLRGAAAIGVEDLIDALVVEDQGDLRNIFSEGTHADAHLRSLPRHQPFLAAETAAEIQRQLEPLLAVAQPLPESVDMPVSDGLKDLFAAAITLSEKLHHEPPEPTHLHVLEVTPLHLMAAALSDEGSATSEVLEQAGITREAVAAAIQSGEYS
jgi:hypothetical protein